MASGVALLTILGAVGSRTLPGPSVDEPTEGKAPPPRRSVARDRFVPTQQASDAGAQGDEDLVPNPDGPPEEAPPGPEFDLPNGLRVEQLVRPSGLLPGDVVSYLIKDLRPGSAWERVGLHIGDRILSANRQEFDGLELDAQLALLGDPAAELYLLVHTDDGGFYTTVTSLEAAQRDGLPARPAFRP